MLERLALILVLTAAAVVAYRLVRLVHMRRMAPAPVAGRPTLLYFRADHCAVCPTQSRYVDQLAAQWDGHIERIDAERDPATAARYRVFTLPTTVLIDGGGQVRHVNYGLTDAHKLGRQVADLTQFMTDGRLMTDHRPQPANQNQEGAQTTRRALWLSSVVRRLSSQ